MCIRNGDCYFLSETAPTFKVANRDSVRSSEGTGDDRNKTKLRTQRQRKRKPRDHFESLVLIKLKFLYLRPGPRAGPLTRTVKLFIGARRLLSDRGFLRLLLRFFSFFPPFPALRLLRFRLSREAARDSY